MLFHQRIELKSPDELRAMRAAGLVVARTLARLRDAVDAGVTTSRAMAASPPLLRMEPQAAR